MGAMQRCSASPEERLCSTVQATWCQGAEDDIPRRYSPPSVLLNLDVEHTRGLTASVPLLDLPNCCLRHQQAVNKSSTCSLQTSLSAPLRLARPI
jgi:hypothetical protein